MLALVIIFAVTTALAIAALVVVVRLRETDSAADPEPAVQAVRAVLAERAPAAPDRPRRFISVEILNPIELAGHRGRIVGIAGSLAPGLTRRIVYDQIVKQMRRMLSEHGVVADVHVHSIHPPAPVLADHDDDDVSQVDLVDDVDELAMPAVATDSAVDQAPV